jgi:hypothetical protein
MQSRKVDLAKSKWNQLMACVRQRVIPVWQQEIPKTSRLRVFAPLR